MSQRHISRQIALQTMYALDVRNDLATDKEEVNKVIDENIEEMSPEHKDKIYLYALVHMVLSRLSTIDEIIVKAAPDWPLDKISYIDRNILRIGLGELLFSDRTEVPPKVAIDQAIELSKAFGAETSSKFINGVLGAIYKELGQPDKDGVPKRRAIEEQLTGVLLYTRHQGSVYIGLVHDLFNNWTICKSHSVEGEATEAGVARVVKKEFGIDTVTSSYLMKEGQYIANHPEKGKIVKHVSYYIAEAVYAEPQFHASGGLDDAKWFRLDEVGGLKIYKEVQSVLVEGIAKINN